MDKAAKPKLKRVVGTGLLALYGIGNIVGAGVYVLVGKIAEPAGYLAIIAFLIAAIIAFCAALSYAELAARFPASAGAAVYLHEAFKKKGVSLAVGIMLIIAGTVSTATLLKGFAGYFYQLVPIEPQLSIPLVASILLFIILRGIKESVITAAFLTLLEVGGLLFLICSITIAQPDVISNYFSGLTQAAQVVDPTLIAGVISGAFIAFYAFIGFEDMVNIAEEVKKPQKAFPKAIFVSMVVVAVLYVAVTIVTLGAVPPQIIAGSNAPLATAYHSATGNNVAIIVITSLFATLNGILVNIIMGSRFLYGMAKRNWIPSWFSKVSGRHVPSRGIMAIGAVATIAALLLPIERLAQITSLLLLCVFISVNVALIVIRRHPRSSAAKELRLSPTFIPWLGVVASGALLIGQGWALL